jgi:alpha-tubulin suppressor-like RCC1 family protein
MSRMPHLRPPSWPAIAAVSTLLLLGCSDSTTGPPATPAQMHIVSGAIQQGTVGQALDTALTVLVSDRSGAPSAGVVVHFSVAVGHGNLTTPDALTDAEGKARAGWTLPTRAGSYHATAVLTGVDSVSFQATAVAAAPALLTPIRGDSQASLIGQALESPVVVRVEDGYGNPVAGAGVHFTAATGHGAPRTPLALTTAAGEASTVWVLGDSAGEMALTATVDTLAPVTFHSTAHFVTPPALDLALGDEHGCAIIPAGTVRCWGVNRAFEVSPSGTIEYRPVDAGGGRAVRAIAAGFNHSCAIASDSLTYCWGDDRLLGAAAAAGGAVPVAVDGNHRFVAISAGGDHTCGVEQDGSAWCWGFNDHGQLGDGNVGTFPASPVRVNGTVRFGWVSAGSGFTCGLSRAGALYCWGLNAQGQLQLPPSGDVPTPTSAPTTLAFIALSGGTDHACAIAVDHRAYCWGSNAGGKLGGGPLTVTTPLVPVAGNHRFGAIGAGGEHSCAVDLGGALYCWGSNVHGAVGGGTMDIEMSPALVSPGGFRALALGYWSSCARASDEAVHCWGDNRIGTLGLGPTGLALTPTAVVSSVPFRTISVGGSHTCAESIGNVPYCWGANTYGEVGVSPTGRPEPLPRAATNGASVASLEAGYAQSCAVLAAGAACWGAGGYLGHGANTPPTPDPLAITGGSTWFAVATSWERTCGLAADSTAYCWGYGTTPSQVPGGYKFKQLVVGDAVSCGLETSGTARCWTEANPAAPPASLGTGYLSLATQAGGACGLDGTGQAICWTTGLVPAALPTTLRFLALAGGGYGATCGVATDGTAYCWGANEFGQLGDGTMTSHSTPTAVAGGHTFVAISAGGFHSCALDGTGVAYCWGQNWGGQIGNGNSATIPAPTRVF